VVIAVLWHVAAEGQERAAKNGIIQLGQLRRQTGRGRDVAIGSPVYPICPDPFGGSCKLASNAKARNALSL